MATTTKTKVAPLKGKPARAWSDREIAFLKRNYKKLTDKQMGESLNRSLSSIAWKRTQLSLGKDGIPAGSAMRRLTSEFAEPIPHGGYGSVPDATKNEDRRPGFLRRLFGRG